MRIRDIRRTYLGQALVLFHFVYDRDNLIALGLQQALGFTFTIIKHNEAWNFVPSTLIGNVGYCYWVFLSIIGLMNPFRMLLELLGGCLCGKQTIQICKVIAQY